LSHHGALATVAAATVEIPAGADPQPYLNSASAKEDQEDYAGAMAIYDALIAVTPAKATVADYYAWRGGDKLDLNDLDGAMADLNQAIALNPKSYMYETLGDVKVEKNDLAGAIDEYNQAISLDPSNADGYTSRGVAQQLQGLQGAALESYKFALAHSQVEGDACLLLWAVEAEGQIRDEANSELGFILATKSWDDPRNSSVAKYLTGELDQNGLLASASPNLSKSMQRDFTCEVCYFIGLKSLLDGDKPTAMTFLKKAVDTQDHRMYEFNLANGQLAALQRSGP
jgi:tetratricopeptide (TPR) repeat protein